MSRKRLYCDAEPMSAPLVDEFFKFLQCQLRMELEQHTDAKLEFADKGAEEMWRHATIFTMPGKGALEKWVPYHTVLGVHELFLVQSIHSRSSWSEYQRFVAMFVFRAHCKCNLFTEAQLPLMQQDRFWNDPRAAFMPGGDMEKSIWAYREKTKAPLLTNAFRSVPLRVVADDTQNLVRSITDRSMALIDIAQEAWTVLKDGQKTSVQKISGISDIVHKTRGCAATWAKMLTVSIDLAYPEAQFLTHQCDVGVGAALPLKCLLAGNESGDSARDLETLLGLVNQSESIHAKCFWAYLEKAESLIRGKFEPLRLVCAQASTKEHAMTASTLQV